jgi:hypothetical protein
MVGRQCLRLIRHLHGRDEAFQQRRPEELLFGRIVSRDLPAVPKQGVCRRLRPMLLRRSPKGCLEGFIGGLVGNTVRPIGLLLLFVCHAAQQFWARGVP